MTNNQTRTSISIRWFSHAFEQGHHIAQWKEAGDIFNSLRHIFKRDQTAREQIHFYARDIWWMLPMSRLSANLVKLYPILPLPKLIF
jgi:hypothetical protein